MYGEEKKENNEEEEKIVTCNLCRKDFDKKTRFMHAVVLSGVDESKVGNQYWERSLYFCSKCTNFIFEFLNI